MSQRPPLLEEHPPRAPAPATPGATYRARAGRFAARRDEYRARSYRNGNLNIALFAGVLACLILGVARGAPLFFALSPLVAAAFVAAFLHQGALDRQQRRYAELAAINEEGLLRLARDWAALPLRRPPGEPPADPLADDLDLLGHASLQHLLGAAGTAVGQATLQGWLLAAAPPAVVRRRQGGVGELTPRLDFREELALGGRLMGTAQASYERFLDWAEGAPWLRPRAWLVWATRILPALTLAALLLQLRGVTPYPFWLGGVAVNILLSWRAGKQVEERLDSVAERQGAFGPYADLYRLLMTQPFASEALRGVQADLSTEGVRADEQMRRLGRIMRFGDLRLSMFFPVIQALLLWNFHVLWALEGWQLAAGRHARGWLATLGEVDALAALAALAYDQPDWAFPELVEGEEAPLVEARALGHPLLPPAVCVRNDLSVGPPGTLLLVTGSNMSGKSTLLRALGLNVALAQAGGPVCAASLRLPPVTLATSIRVRDSLEQGVSYFMAELRRLKEIVDAADRARASGGEGGRTLLYLLDEILQGTNTGERQIAARRILRHLLAAGAIGVVSTHDLTLADDAGIRAAAAQVHFTERFTRGPEGPSMSFDYTLRPGLATSTNALNLMEIVGLRLDDLDDEGREAR